MDLVMGYTANTILTRFMLFISYVVIIGDCKMQPFIVNGGNGKIEDFPYSAQLNIKCLTERESLRWSCGGSIINQYLVLTAGHCLSACAAQSPTTASFGHEDMRMGIARTVRNFVIHEHYIENLGINDIAILRLNAALEFNSKISRVVLMGRPPYREEAVVAGWGFIDEVNKINTKVLKFTNQYVWERKACWKLLKTLPKGTICARSKDGYSYAALGDSGSALVVRGYIQIGLVSHKLPVSDSVAIYTDTGYFYKWIQSTANKLMCT